MNSANEKTVEQHEKLPIQLSVAQYVLHKFPSMKETREYTQDCRATGRSRYSSCIRGLFLAKLQSCKLITQIPSNWDFKI